MNKVKDITLLIIFALAFLQPQAYAQVKSYSSETLKINQLTAKTFVHITYLETQDFGKVACNGLIYANEGKAVVFDTPTNDATSNELIKWIENELGCTVTAVVINHFHGDCLGGLKAFHDAGIESYANEVTIRLAKEQGHIVPKSGFNGYQKLLFGEGWIINVFLGEGHTVDNIVSYLPDEKVLFGGCLIKSIDASKGFLGDANVNEWSNTVLKVRNKFDEVEVVVPGHGKPGDVSLLDYTIGLFGPK